jgi:SAM-dependent MidA family methyltransferase
LKTPLSKDQLGGLPVPSADALAHSQALKQHIVEDIEAAGGWISFARYMDLALYAPGLGYYSAGSRKFGQGGDFVTAPEISTLFGQCVANQIADVLRETGGSVLELGPGSGKLAFDVLNALRDLDVVPERYLLLDVSADLRERQRDRLMDLEEIHAGRVQWIDSLPHDFTGVIIANEVLDVLPVHLVQYVDGWAFERGVHVENGEFAWRAKLIEGGPLVKEATRIASEYLQGDPPANYTSEICLAAPAWTQSLVQALRKGAVLLVDYGFRAAEYYHPSRAQGTLMCHYRHYAHGDPFYLPGLQDITAHVDFSLVAKAAGEAGAEVLGYTTQGGFLLNAGLTELLQNADPSNAAAYLPLANQAQRLVSPAEMGEFFKVLALGKGLSNPLRGFAGRGLPL